MTPYANRGVPVPSSPQFSIDWLRWSTRDPAEFRRFMSHFQDILQGEVATIERPFPFYDTAYQMRIGRVDWHSEKPDQGVLFTLTGKDLVAWLENGGDHQILINYISRLPALTVSRLDFAVDVFSPDAHPNQVYEKMEAGLIKTTARNYSRLQSRINGGEIGVTVYIGSRTSNRLIRVYDKAIQAGAKYPWIRIEIELKKTFALLTLRQMAEHGIVRTGKAAIRDFVRTDLDWLDGAVDGEDVTYITPGERKDTAWEKWIKTVVLPNAVRAIAADVAGFRDAMQAALDAAERSKDHGRP
jgi:hypothetical protein